MHFSFARAKEKMPKEKTPTTLRCYYDGTTGWSARKLAAPRGFGQVPPCRRPCRLRLTHLRLCRMTLREAYLGHCLISCDGVGCRDAAGGVSTTGGHEKERRLVTSA